MGFAVPATGSSLPRGTELCLTSIGVCPTIPRTATVLLGFRRNPEESTPGRRPNESRRKRKPGTDPRMRAHSGLSAKIALGLFSTPRRLRGRRTRNSLNAGMHRSCSASRATCYRSCILLNSTLISLTADTEFFRDRRRNWRASFRALPTAQRSPGIPMETLRCSVLKTLIFRRFYDFFCNFVIVFFDRHTRV